MTTFSSVNPVDQSVVWQGIEASEEMIHQAIARAQTAFTSNWSTTSFEDRALIAKKFITNIDDRIVHAISKEMGKPLWESRQEVEAMKRKVEISISAYLERTPQEVIRQQAITRHRPHGVVAVFGPFNFPAHLPNGHIVPLLLAGNTILFKPSELTPLVAELTHQAWMDAGLPRDVLQIVQGGKAAGQLLTLHPDIRGIFFTGSAAVGRAIVQASFAFPNRIVALEMGGNNPLIVGQFSNTRAAAFLTIQSAFLTSGQRCTAARRLIIIKTDQSAQFLQELVETTNKLSIGPYTDSPEPYMGPVVSSAAAKKIMDMYQALVQRGGTVLLPMQHRDASAFLSPGLIDMTGIAIPDEEIFGPLLQVIQVSTLDEAIRIANQTSYGLTAGIISDDEREYRRVYNEVRAGIINWNAPLTGASGYAPFGGLGLSGNFRPSAYYAADYSAYPVASTENTTLQLPAKLPPGFPM